MVNFLEKEVTKEIIEIGIDFPTLQLVRSKEFHSTNTHTVTPESLPCSKQHLCNSLCCEDKAEFAVYHRILINIV